MLFFDNVQNRQCLCGFDADSRRFSQALVWVQLPPRAPLSSPAAEASFSDRHRPGGGLPKAVRCKGRRVFGPKPRVLEPAAIQIQPAGCGRTATEFLKPVYQTRSLLKNSVNSSCSGVNALTSLRLHHRSLRICSVGAPRHRIHRASKLNSRNLSTDS